MRILGNERDAETEFLARPLWLSAVPTASEAQRKHWRHARWQNCAGTCTVPASFGSTTRYRFNCGGDRQLNKGFYAVAWIRIHWDQTTKEYVAK
ncbi:transposase [Arthrobacter alpinus]|uniref:transposase n=1 Tax=Arthrobacter alpinus TaxID=656366 RepID=UPI003CC7AB84